MQINKVSNQQPSFGKLYSGESLKRALNPSTHKLIRKYETIKAFIRTQKLHKLENIDITLNYSNCDGFYGIISNKKNEVPTHCKSYYCKVNSTAMALETFKDWATKWNNTFSH